MGAVWARLRSEARARWWSWVALALVAGIAAAAVLTVAEGARRTDSAYSRFLDSHAPSDFLIGDSSDFGFTNRLDLDAVARLPEVEASTRVRALIAGGRTDRGVLLLPGYTVPFVALDDGVGVTVDRWKLLSGRRADPSRPDEVVLSFEFARRLDMRPGATFTLRFVTNDVFFARTAEFIAGIPDRIAGNANNVSVDALLSLLDGPRVTFHVVGIEASPLEFPPLPGNTVPVFHLTRAFDEQYGELGGQDILRVRLRNGADSDAFRASVERLAGGTTAVFFGVGADNAVNVDRSIHLQALALWILAGLVGVSVAFAIGQAFVRQAFTQSGDFPTLFALGMTRGQLIAVSAVRAAATGLLGVVLAGSVALALSPVWPFGLARNAEPEPGFHADWFVLGVGGAAFVVLAVLSGALATVRLLDRVGRARVRSRRVALSSLSRLRPPIGIGIRQALTSGGGTSVVPVRSAMFATGLAVATIVAAVTFGASIDRLLATPRLYGWAHDAQIGSLGLPSLAEPVVNGLERSGTAESIAVGTVIELDVAGMRVSAFALDNVRGTLRPDLLEGRAAQTADEIVLGTKTLEAAGAEIGDHVRVSIAGTVVQMRVVGRAVFPDIGDNGQLGRGAQITFGALRDVTPDAPSNIVQVAFARDVDATAVVARLQDATTPLPVLFPEPPADLTSFGRVDNLPLFVAAAMLLVAGAVLIHTMVTSIRRRRREFAILETLGWARRQVGTAVAVQATAFACVALLVGVPLGLAAGRFAWSAVAASLGVPSEPTTSATALVVAILGILLLANIAALLPAWLARRASPATVLRAE